MTGIEKRIRWSGLLICAGLAILLVSLVWSHPLAFMVFLCVGFPLVLAGVLLFLYSIAFR